MKVVWKYNLIAGAINNITLPIGSELLCAHAQKDEMCLWVLNNGNTATENRRFIVVGTGHVFDIPVKRYIGTVLSPDQTFVFHAFEVF